MSDAPDRQFGFETRMLHAGHVPDALTGARAVPIYQTTSYVFDDADTAAQLFELKQYGNIYTRIGNPTTAVLEERLASLENATGAVAVASGMAAQFVALMTLLSPGDEIVASSHLYGGTVTQLTHTFRKLSISVRFVDPTRLEHWEQAITPRTRALYGETVVPSELQELAHRHLLMHFTRNGAFGPGGNRLLVLERGEGAYVFDTDGKRYLDGLSSLFCCQLGYSFGEEMASVAGEQLSTLVVQHELGHRAPAGDPARRRAGRARARRHQPRVLHQRRLGVGRGRLEDRPPALPRQGRAAAHEGDRARDRLPRRHARRAVVHRRAPDEGAVRRVADPGRARLEHQPVPPRAGRRPGRALRAAAARRWSRRSSRPDPRRWR